MATRNPLRKLSLQGKIGQILSANEATWLHSLLTANPGLLAGFADPYDPTIFKTMWHGEFPGKLLTGIAQTYLLGNHPATRELGDRLADGLRAVQETGGYLGPWPQETRFERDAVTGVWGKWDTWGHYHCIYGLYRWYQVTGNQTALDTARRALDCVYDHFITGGISVASQKWTECNLAIAHAFALFYEETGDPRYLAAAERLVREDMTHLYPDFYTQTTLSCDWLNKALAGVPYHASGQPRWEGLYTLETFAVLYRVTGNEEYRHAVSSLWQGMAASDRHNTGSFGTGEGATGNLYGAGSETCNTVAWMAFTTDYLAMTRDPLAADELELSFFNATLGSLLAGERSFTYMNDSNGTRAPARDVLKDHSFIGGRDMSCCQANGNRGLSQISEWAVLGEGRDLCLNYYGDCVVTAETEDGRVVRILQATDYPVSGRISVSVETDCNYPLTLRFRIPAWSRRTDLTVNGEPVAVTAGTYCAVTRLWSKEDRVELELDMTPHFWYGETGTPAEGRISVYRGPVLLAIQGAENPPIPFAALGALTPTEGEGIVTLSADTPDGQLTLTDYYTAGRDGTPYASWIACEDAPAGRDTAAPIWCQT